LIKFTIQEINKTKNRTGESKKENPMLELGYYPGCTVHSTGLEYTLSLTEVFKHLGIKLVEISEWNCCGGAAAHSLSRLLGLVLPARNVAKAQESGLPLTVPCPACFNSIKRAQNALSEGSGLKETLEGTIGFKYQEDLVVKTTHQVILDHIGIDKLSSLVKKPLSGLKVVSYYGCLLVRDPEVVKMGEYENPVFLDSIVEALGARPLDWSYKTDCCGADLGMTHGRMAREITDRITDMALEAGADVLMTGCGLCQINLDMRQSRRAHKGIPVLYMTEMMGTALDLPGRNKWWSKHVIDPIPVLGSLDLI
jgi:heterodisulfide reductase subunit B